MTFFGPPPESPGEVQPPRWGPPLWDRAAEDTLGVTVGLTVPLVVADEYAIVFDGVHAYPNGFSFELVKMSNPNIPLDHERMHERHRFMTGPRLGLEFSDGSVASTEAPSLPGGGGPGRWSSMMLVSAASSAGDRGLDADGVPIGHVLRMHGGGGSQYRMATEYWCFRLPAPGTMTIHADWPDHFEEVAIDVDVAPILDAATRSTILWPRT